MQQGPALTRGTSQGTEGSYRTEVGFLYYFLQLHGEVGSNQVGCSGSHGRKFLGPAFLDTCVFVKDGFIESLQEQPQFAFAIAIPSAVWGTSCQRSALDLPEL